MGIPPYDSAICDPGRTLAAQLEPRRRGRRRMRADLHANRLAVLRRAGLQCVVIRVVRIFLMAI